MDLCRLNTTFIMSRMMLIILALILGFRAHSQVLSELEFGQDETLDVVTWNIEWFPKDGQTTVDSVSAVIAAIDADVIAFQEIGDTALFRSMINGIPGYSPLVLDAWSGGLAYCYKNGTVNIIDLYEIFEEEEYWNALPRSPHVLHFEFNGEEIFTINNHFKCCGDESLDLDDEFDEENRRLQASNLIESYIDENLATEPVIMLGDLNDLLQDVAANNVFISFFDDPDNYQFTDIDIALNQEENWSYPSWPSHLDHLLITNELFESFSDPGSSCETIRIDDFLQGGFSTYDDIISDHRPVGLKLNIEDIPDHIAESSDNDFHVWPLPSNGQLTIEPEDSMENLGWVINDLGGKEMMRGLLSGETTQLDVGELGSGQYILTIENLGSRVISIQR